MLRRVVAKLAATLKAAKYSKQDLHYMFQPVAGEWWHVTFSANLGRRISSVFGDDGETLFVSVDLCFLGIQFSSAT